MKGKEAESAKPRIGRVNHSDCIAGMAAMKAASVDLVFADPPFNIGYDYDEYDDRRERDAYLRWSRDWIAAVFRVLKPNGTFWLAIGDEYAAELKLISQNGYPSLPLTEESVVAIGKQIPPDGGMNAVNTRHKNARSNSQSRRRSVPQAADSHQVPRGFTCRSWVIWYYTFGVHCKMKFTRSHAHLFQFVKDPGDFTFNVESVRVPSARQLVYGDKRANPEGRMPDDTWMMPAGTPTADGFVLRPQDIPEGFRPESNSWYFARVAGTFKEREGWHGCQMPEQLLGRIIRASSNKGDVVLDPFTGSGTTLVVAKKLARKCVGFELSRQYFDQAERRLASAKSGDQLDGAENPLTSAPTTLQPRVSQRRRRPRSRPEPMLFAAES